MKRRINKGLIFNSFEHSFDENCPLTAVNASHFLPCELFSELNFKSFAK
ncbi:MAG: hypothetical protein WCI72_06320 [archaeon]